MRTHVKEPNPPGGTWGLPLTALIGTIAGMLFTFTRIGTEPEWKILLEGIGLSVGVTGSASIVLMLAVRSRREL